MQNGPASESRSPRRPLEPRGQILLLSAHSLATHVVPFKDMSRKSWIMECGVCCQLFGKPQTLFVAAAQDSGILIVLSFDSFFADPGSKLPGWIQSMKSMHGSTDSKQHRLTRNQPLQATLVPMRPSQLRPRSQLHQPPLQPPLSSCHLCMRRLSKCWSRNSRKKRCWCSTGHSQRVEESLRPYSPCHSSTAGLTGDCPHSLNRPCRALAGGSTATQCCRKVFVSKF